MGEVRFNPFSYTYNGHTEWVEEYFSGGEPTFLEVVSSPDGMLAAPEMAEVTDERTKLNRMKAELRRFGMAEFRISEE